MLSATFGLFTAVLTLSLSSCSRGQADLLRQTVLLLPEYVPTVPGRGDVRADSAADLRQDALPGGVQVRPVAGPVHDATLPSQAVLRQDK